MRIRIGILLLFGLLAAPARPEAEDRPNIVFLFADDLGFGDLACTGHPYARTPNLDRLAADGTRFTQFAVTGVTCCPSRTGIMTGKLPATYATYPANGGFGDRVTVTELLQKGGYATGHFGKWHIGPETKPGTYGIDAIEVSGGGRRDDRGRDAAIYDDAIRFIDANQDRPFYVNVWGHGTHHPVNPPKAFADRFKDVAIRETDFAPPMREKFAAVKSRGGDPAAAMRNYLGDVLALDEAVGRLLRRLDELGLRKKTLVVFSSDHGSPFPKEAGDGTGMNLMGYNGGLRGGKHGMYEGGVRVPFIVRWPEHVPAGRVDTKTVISGSDWLPTICALTGVGPLPAGLDGEDVSKAWLGGDQVRSKPLFWKVSNPRADVGIREGRWKLICPHRKKGEVELYDLEADPVESKNVAEEHPDVVNRLRARAEAWNATLPTAYEKTDDPDD